MGAHDYNHRDYQPKLCGDLEPGDETPWYEVLWEPLKTGDPGEISIKVRHKGTETEGFVYGNPEEEVPVKVAASS